MILELVLQNILAAQITAEIDTGAGAQGDLRFETSGDAEVATIDFNTPPSFGAPVVGVITLNGVTLSDLSATGGTTVQASIFDRDGTKQLEMTVGTSGTEIIITSTVIAATEQVDLTALTLEVPTGP
jgi:hypothetical protein